VSDTEQLLNDPAMVEKAFDDPDIRKMPVLSSEFNAALSDESKTVSNDDDAPAGDDELDQDEHSDETRHEGKKPRARDRRIDQLTAKVGELTRQLGERQVEQPQVQQRQEYIPQLEKPQFANFDTIADYTEALTDWKLDSRRLVEEHNTQQRGYQEQADKVRDSWNEREVEVRKEYSDYDDVVNVGNLNTLNPSEEAKYLLSESADGPKVMYELLADDGLADKFAKANPVMQVAMLAKLEASLGTSSNRETTIASKASEPPRRLPSGRGTTATRNILDNAHNMSFEEFDRQMNAYQRGKKSR
jgi:hypothetical protein